ncbi:MAG: DUF1778 domain-containing protein [Planctomycetia bacterium]|nr:DUF1778 domain-containing protein [Planctomycetia bacterium]
MPTRTERLDMRLTPEQKDLLERAASLTGQPLTGFALSNLVERAQEIIERSGRTLLSRRDAEKFLKLLEAPPEPVPALKAALRRRNARRG